MSLDLAVLAEDGTPEHIVSLSVNLHHELIVAAGKLGLDQLLRLEDYYEDVELLPDDLPALAEQVEVLQPKVGSDDLRKFLGEFEALINNAASCGKALHAIAD